MDDAEDVITSDLDDLEHAPLAGLDTADETMAGMLRRIIPAAPGQRVAVAAFNSSV